MWHTSPDMRSTIACCENCSPTRPRTRSSASKIARQRPLRSCNRRSPELSESSEQRKTNRVQKPGEFQSSGFPSSRISNAAPSARRNYRICSSADGAHAAQQVLCAHAGAVFVFSPPLGALNSCSPLRVDISCDSDHLRDRRDDLGRDVFRHPSAQVSVAGSVADQARDRGRLALLCRFATREDFLTLFRITCSG